MSKLSEQQEKIGRPTSYDSAVMPEQAEKLCSLGATDDEIADFFGVSTRTVYRWKCEHEEFCQALKSGKQHSDERVERSLYQKATGYNFVQQEAKVIKTGQHTSEVRVVDVECHQPADTTAAIFWLKNRRKEEWRDKREVDIKNVQDASDLTDAELADLAVSGSSGAAKSANGAKKPNKLH